MSAASDGLVVAEIFYSIQGEGVTTGVPALFLRLGGCNLECDFRDSEGRGNPCDTIPVWKNGKRMSFEEILKQIAELGCLEWLSRRLAHLVITGGEPLLQQERLVRFIEFLCDHIRKPYIEIETNGTQLLSKAFGVYVDQINCSPKLESSSMPLEKRRIPEVLKQFKLLFAGQMNGSFKFVVTEERDVKEIFGLQVEFRIPAHDITLMPEGVNQQDLQRKRIFVAELCKKYGYRYSDRLQVAIWGEVTGV